MSEQTNQPEEIQRTAATLPDDIIGRLKLVDCDADDLARIQKATEKP